MNPEVTRPMFAEQPWFQRILRDWGFRPTAATMFTNGRASLRLEGTVLIAIPADGAKVWRSELNQASPKAVRQLLDTILASPSFLSQAELDRRVGRAGQAQEALRNLAGSIRENPDSHSGPQLRRFLWSHFNGHHALNLWGLKSVLDSRHNKWVAEAFNAWMEGHVSEGALRTALRDSGELERGNIVTTSAAGQDRLTQAMDAITGLLNSTSPGLTAAHLSRANGLLQEAADQIQRARRSRLMDRVWDHSTFSKNQERLLAHNAAELFFARVVAMAREQGWTSEAHFTVDGTLIDAWASLKSFQPKQGPKTPNDGDSGNPSLNYTATSGAMRPTRAPRTRRLSWPGREKGAKPV